LREVPARARKSEGPWYRSGKDCWYVWHQGKLVRLPKDRAEADRLYHLLLAGAWPAEQPPKAAALPTPPPSPPTPALTVGELVDAYLADASLRLKPSTLLSKRKVLLRLKTDTGTEQAASLKPAVVSAWLARQKGWGRSLRWLAGLVIRACCRWAANPTQGLLASDPTAGLKLPGPRSRGAEALVSPEAHAKVVAKAPPCYRDALLALHGTGCRPAELCAVEARHFDAQIRAWLLQEHKTDGTGKIRVIFLPPAVVEMCKRRAEAHPTGPLFRNNKGRPLSPDRLRNWLFKTRRRLELGRITPYGYRHGFATDALVNGVPDAQVAELLGHQGTTILHRHYAHLGAKAEALRTALGRVR
jgi:integrase